MAVPTVTVIDEGTKPWSAVMVTGTAVIGRGVAVADGDAVGVSEGTVVVAVGAAAVIVGVVEGRLVDVAIEVSDAVGLSVGVADVPRTMIVPAGLLTFVTWYGKVPADEKGVVCRSPWLGRVTVKAPVSEVMVWETSSVLYHWMAVPTVMVTVGETGPSAVILTVTTSPDCSTGIQGGVLPIGAICSTIANKVNKMTRGNDERMCSSPHLSFGAILQYTLLPCQAMPSCCMQATVTGDATPRAVLYTRKLSLGI